jgi:hypothetical protein
MRVMGPVENDPDVPSTSFQCLTRLCLFIRRLYTNAFDRFHMQLVAVNVIVGI